MSGHDRGEIFCQILHAFDDFELFVTPPFGSSVLEPHLQKSANCLSPSIKLSDGIECQCCHLLKAVC